MGEKLRSHPSLLYQWCRLTNTVEDCGMRCVLLVCRSFWPRQYRCRDQSLHPIHTLPAGDG